MYVWAIEGGGSRCAALHVTCGTKNNRRERNGVSRNFPASPELSDSGRMWSARAPCGCPTCPTESAIIGHPYVRSENHIHMPMAAIITSDVVPARCTVVPGSRSTIFLALSHCDCSRKHGGVGTSGNTPFSPHPPRTTPHHPTSTKGILRNFQNHHNFLRSISVFRPKPRGFGWVRPLFVQTNK